MIAQGTLVARTLHRALRIGIGAARFARKEPVGALALVIIIGMILMAVFAYQVAPYEPNTPNVAERLQGPSAAHWFGTDVLGRDMYSRIVHGARVSFIVAFFSIGIGTTSGYMLGLIGGYVGGRFDLAVQRVMDVLLALPGILKALVIVTLLGAGIDKVIIAIAVAHIPGPARIARGVVLSTKENVYVEASRTVGASGIRIMLVHLLPNCMAPFLILASIGLAQAILTEASLSYLGLGVPPPHASWGRMLSTASISHFADAPWLVIAPGLAIMSLVLVFNMFGDTLRDLWDPKLRGRGGR